LYTYYHKASGVAGGGRVVAAAPAGGMRGTEKGEILLNLFDFLHSTNYKLSRQIKTQ